ncbi:hypothetical protein BKA57DRAFT_164508 [Linnemannia elongata]|nr:hypothetical protein BKA57DRAFT_164508 [Linnemannia elongata]
MGLRRRIIFFYLTAAERAGGEPSLRPMQRPPLIRKSRLYPNDTIDIVVTGAVLSPASPPVTLSNTAKTQANTGNQGHQSQLLSTQDLDFSVSSISLRPLR